MTTWLDNEELFVQQLGIGHHYAEFVGHLIRGYGIQADVTPMMVRAHVDRRHDFVDEYDLLVAGRHRVEVKSRNIVFHEPWQYPYQTAYVYSKRGWDRKTRKPAAIIIVSQRTGCVAVVPRSTEDLWETEVVHDTVRNIDYEALVVDKGMLRSLDEFVAWVQR